MSSVMTLEKVRRAGMPVASSITITPSVTASNGLEAYPHGWRYVRRSVNGEDRWVRVALTREDVLHPQLGDKKVHSEYHERFSTYLYDVLGQQVADDPHAVVLHDVGIVWDDPDLKHHAPDIAVIFDVRKRKEWSTFNVAKEGTKPALVIEVVSLSNRSTDVADKLAEYEAAGVPLYIIVDTYRYRGKLYRRLLGYKLNSRGRYKRMIPNEKGWLWLEPVRLWINVENNKVVCYDASGEAIPDYTGVVAQRNRARIQRQQALAKAKAELDARDAAEAQAQAEAQAREAAEAQAQQARAKAQAEAQAREAAEAQAQQAKAKAQAEAQAKEAAEAKAQAEAQAREAAEAKAQAEAQAREAAEAKAQQARAKAHAEAQAREAAQAQAQQARAKAHAEAQAREAAEAQAQAAKAEIERLLAEFARLRAA